MAILTEKKSWTRPKKASRGIQLTPVERMNVKRALRAVRRRYGSSERLAAALGMSRTTVAQAAGNGRVSPELAFGVARVAGVSLGKILEGLWPEPRVCPMCGQVTT